jgi:rhodanese-related sulfurtransferase
MDSRRLLPDDGSVAAAVRRRTLDELLAEARRRIVRLSPAQAFAAARNGALIVDIRADLDREQEGVIPGSLHIPRTVLEWRVDPDSPWRNPHLAGLAQQLVIVCDHGYSSSLAAATLADLGLSRVGDVIGGFEAWRRAGLPIAAPGRGRRAGELPGMGPPETAEDDG